MKRADRKKQPLPPSARPRTALAPADVAYAAAVTAMTAGDLDRAESLYQRCLAANPIHVAALHDLGVVAIRSKRHDVAVARFGQVLALKPDHAAAFLNLALALCEGERWAEARVAAERAVALRPRCAGSLATLGHVLSFTPDLAAAAAACARALAIDPRCIPAVLRRARILRRMGENAEALSCCDTLIRLTPRDATGYIERAATLARLDRLDDAEATLETAARLDPSNPDIDLALANIFSAADAPDRAIAALDRAIARTPDVAVLHMDRAIYLQRQGRFQDALTGFRATIERDRSNAVAYFNIGILMLQADQKAVSIGFFEHAIALQPRMVEGYLQLSEALKHLGQQGKAIAALEQALRLAPERLEIRLQICWTEMHGCIWAGQEGAIREILDRSIAESAVISPFVILAFGLSSLETLLWARVWSERYIGTSPEPLTAYDVASPRPSARIRVGYLSADFKGHATAALMREMLHLHDRSRFDIIGYNIGRTDQSELGRGMIEALDQIVDVAFLTDRDAARRIADDDITILIDLKGFTTDSRPGILAHRPAPIQVNYLGYPGSMGTRAIDYIVADAVIAPFEHQPFYDEAIVHLPDCYQPNDRNRPTADPSAMREAYGLPAEGFVFCCFNNTYKITPLVFDLWMRLLRDVPGSVLWLFRPNELVEVNLNRAAEERGIESRRLVYAPRLSFEGHMARLGLADLFLDTLPVNAHTTASEALWAGVPVLTCLGPQLVGRVAASLLTSIGLPELITADFAAYETLARSLALDPAALTTLRRRLATNRDTAPLFDTQRYTRNFEAALARMVELRNLGHPPAPFAVVDPEGWSHPGGRGDVPSA